MNYNKFDGFGFSVIPVESRINVGHFHLDIPYSYEEIHAELENEDWEKNFASTNHKVDFWGQSRFTCGFPQEENQKLIHIHHYFRCTEFKKQFINTLYEISPGMDTRWDLTPDEMFKYSNCSGSFLRDMPGFVNQLHTDYRQLIATAMIYWTKEDDPDLSSMFYTSINRDNPVRITTNFCDGWIHSNEHDTFHEGWNRTSNVRYSSLIGLGINIAPVY